MTDSDKWAALSAPFELDEIELLPRYTGPRDDKKRPKNPRESCKICGGYHPNPSIHLSYVGHAGITKRLNSVDPTWNWEPVALNEDGTPKLTRLQAYGDDTSFGLWIRLTVLGVTRYGFGDIGDKTTLSGSAMKELIGDAIRNAAMRFGVGTYLWSKSEAAKAELTRQGGDEPEPAPALITDAQMKALRASQKASGITDDVLHIGIKRDFGVDSTKQLTKAQASQLIDRLKKIEGTDHE